MKLNKFLILLIITVLIVPSLASADINSIRDEYRRRGLSGSGLEQEAIDKYLREIRRQDQQIRDQVQADAEYTQGFYEMELDYFYILDDIKKQIDALYSSDSDYAVYKMYGMDCLQSMRIPSDPTDLPPDLFLSLMENKEKCNDYLLKYKKKPVATPIATPIQQPIKSKDQICSDKFGLNWKWISGTTCGCKDGYTQKNGNCVTYDQSCNINYPNSKFLKFDDTDGHRVCDCKTGYVWNDQKTGCIIAPLVPVKTIAPIKSNDQICSDEYGLNSNWDGTKTDDGKINCGCKNGYLWDEQRTICIKKQEKQTPSSPVVEKVENNKKQEPEVLGVQIDMTLSKRLKGRLLLQVEQGGSIWYIDTMEFNRYSVTWANALPLFKKLSLGITDADLVKIPIAGSSEVGSWSMRNRLKGKLLLQVEQRGAIWFVDQDGFRHSVTWDNLLPLFESLALGITNNDLYKIPIGSLEGF